MSDERLGPSAVYRGVFPDLNAGARPPTAVRMTTDPFIDPTNPKHPSGIIRYFQIPFDQCGCFTALQIIPDGFYDTVTVCGTYVAGDLTDIYPVYLSHDLVVDGPQDTRRVALSLRGYPFPASITDVNPVAAALSGPSQAANIRYDLPLCNRPLLVWAWDNGINIGSLAQPIRVVTCLMTLRH